MHISIGFFLLWTFIVAGVLYFVGSNNPYPAAKRKLIAKLKAKL